MPYAAAQDGLFPRQFAQLHSRWKTPVFGLVVSSAFISILMLMNYSQTLVEQFNFVILLATLTTLVPYAYAAAAEMELFISERERFSVRNLARDLVIAVLAFAYAIYAIVGAGTDVIAKGFILLMLGMPVYVYLKWREQSGQVSANATSGTRSTKRVLPKPIAR